MKKVTYILLAVVFLSCKENAEVCAKIQKIEVYSLYETTIIPQVAIEEKDIRENYKGEISDIIRLNKLFFSLSNLKKAETDWDAHGSLVSVFDVYCQNHKLTIYYDGFYIWKLGTPFVPTELILESLIRIQPDDISRSSGIWKS